MDIIRTRTYSSPCGELILGASASGLCLCDWLTAMHHDRTDKRMKRLLKVEFEEGFSDVTEKAAGQLDEYFAGKRREFDVPLLFVGTEFQKRVWNELLRIPFGRTISYGELARRIGMPSASRAVANANNANPISIFVPCHRVIGSDGSLTGYGGGLEAKQMLLGLESPSLFDVS